MKPKKMKMFSMIIGLFLCANGVFGQDNIGSNKEQSVLKSVTENDNDQVIAADSSATSQTTSYFSTGSLSPSGSSRLCGEVDHLRSEMAMYPTLLKSNQREAYLHVGIEAEKVSVEIKVYSMTGEIMLLEDAVLFEGENIIDLPVGDLPAGLFVLVMMNGENMLGHSKFVKQ